MKENFVIISNIEWGFLKQRHQFLAEQLSEQGANVIFIESSAKRNPKLNDIPRILDRLQKVIFTKKSKESDSDNTTADTNTNNSKVNIITPFVLPSTLSIFRLFNKLLFLKPLKKKINSKIKKEQTTTVICYLPSSTSFELIESVKPDRVVYDCVSNFEALKNMPKDTVQLENKLIELADVTYVDCDFLYEKHKQKANKICLLEPGVDFELFANLNAGKEIKEIRNIGY